MKRKLRFRSRGAKYGKNNSKLPLEFTKYYVNTIKGLFFKKDKTTPGTWKCGSCTCLVFLKMREVQVR